ncbi:MAG TPA: hypothetical protein VMZ90_02850 [Vicinamibacterales bacterium]|nr:hypothetical protein [Vicinamibacterales bacterium]
MRTWVKASLIGVSLVLLVFLAFAGTSTYFVMRHLDRSTSTEVAAAKDFDAIRTRFGARAPLIEVVNASIRELKINRPEQADGRPISTLHILNWKQENNEVLRTEVPVWLMRFSSINILSKLGIAPERFSLTVQDLERYGPGVVMDYRRPGEYRVLLWME